MPRGRAEALVTCEAIGLETRQSVGIVLPDGWVSALLDEGCGLAADRVAHALLESIDAAVAVTCLGTRLLVGLPLAVEALRPGRVRLCQAGRAPPCKWSERDPQQPMRQPELREADEDDGELEQEPRDRCDDEARGVR